MTAIVAIDGIGPAYAKMLRAAGIDTTEALLERGASPEGRRAIMAETGIGLRLIIEWVTRADLLRVDGIDADVSELLEYVDIATVEELAARRADRLHTRCLQVCETEDHLDPPSESQVEGWVAHAQRLEPRVIR